MNLTTTFDLLHKAGACTSRYKFLRESLKDVKDDEPINLLTILETNGFDDALWALCATAENCDKVARLMAADFAEGRITRDELTAAEAARDAAEAARDAAWADAGAAAEAAARDAQEKIFIGYLQP